MNRRSLLWPLALAGAFGIGVALNVGMHAANAASQHKIGMMNSTYGPGAISARVGDTIVFDNDDYENHWVYVPTVDHQVSRAGIKPGEKFEIMLGKPGKFLVLCALHTKMTTTISVVK
jgi:plastocyanin